MIVLKKLINQIKIRKTTQSHLQLEKKPLIS